jgi:hypothetical protein
MNEISIINSKELKTLGNKNEYIFVNFADNNALKISYFYDEIKKNERNKLISLFKQLTGIEIRLDDILGKLHIVLLKLILEGKKDNIVISSIGFHMASFEFLIDNFKTIFENLCELVNKKIIIVECNLNDLEDAKSIEQYFEV